MNTALCKQKENLISQELNNKAEGKVIFHVTN